MPNPNYSELALDIKYGLDADSYQSTRIEVARNEYSDEPEQKFWRDIDDLAGRIILLDHYNKVALVIIQNIDDTHIMGYDYDDEISGDNIIGEIPPGEFLIINRPDVTVDILLICADADEAVDAHVVIFGDLL
jgi:hypothetical protein